MKRIYYFLVCFYSVLILGIIIHYIFSLFDFQWQVIFSDLEKLEKFLFFIFVLTLSLMILMTLSVRLVQLTTLSQVQKNLNNILEGRKIQDIHQADLDRSFRKIHQKVNALTENLQKTQNQVLQSEEVIIEKERKRIARDLHDTVSQELFAANMILSGVAGQVEFLDAEALTKQLQGVSGILNTAQKDLRILLLHLRPTELEGRSLIEGLQVILKELTDKSDMEVNFQHDIQKLPKQIEEHVFRIAQEIISNTLRHANANRLDVYLYQTRHELQLRMTDDGIGFDLEQSDDLSYGLINIKERVHDMAGTIQILTAPRQGVAIDVRVPLLEGV